MFTKEKYIWYNIDMEKDIFNISKNELSYGMGMYIPYSTIWSGVQNTGKRS